jgi:glycosyltransferase involved in cell wall biosynthesis
LINEANLPQITGKVTLNMKNKAFEDFYPRVLNIANAKALCDSLLDKSIIIYGSTEYGTAVRNYYLTLGKDIVCFCDRDETKQAFGNFGKEVISPEQLPGKIDDNTAVLNVVQLKKTQTVINENLIRLGIPENIIYQLEFGPAKRPIPVPIDVDSKDISNFDKPLLDDKFYTPCAIPQTDKVGVFMKVYRPPHQYLIRAIQSVREQSYKNLKLTIAANDCLPETLALLYKYAEIDKRIEIINNPHNTWAVWEPETAAIYAKIAEHFTSDGDYFCTIDNDDYYAPDFLEKTVEVMRREHPDVVQAGAQVYKADGPESVCSFVMPFTEKTYSGNEKMGEYLWFYGVHHVIIWGKLYTKKAMDLHFKFATGGDDGKGSVITPDNIWTDDWLYIHHLFPLLEKVSVIPDEMYFWTRHKASFLTKQPLSICFFCYAILKPYIYEYLKDYPERDGIWDYMIHIMGYYLGVDQIEEYIDEAPNEVREALLKIRAYINENFTGKALAGGYRRIDELLYRLEEKKK